MILISKHSRKVFQMIMNWQVSTLKLKSFDVMNAIYWITETWNDIKSTTIIKPWRKIILNQNSKLPLSEPINEENICEWINTDEQQQITNEIIVNNENDCSDDDSDNENWHMKISHTDGLKATWSAIEYIEPHSRNTATRRHSRRHRRCLADSFCFH